jgi:hypothetical protein
VIFAVLFLATCALPVVASAQALTGMSPIIGPPGTQVTFTGSGFGQTAGEVSLTGQSANISSISRNAAVLSWSDSRIVCVIPAGLVPGLYYPSLATAAGEPVGPGSDAAWPLFTVTAASGLPRVTSLAPVSGVPGTPFTITGTGFGSIPGGILGSVTFVNEAAMTPGDYSFKAVITSWTDTAIKGYVPVMYSDAGLSAFPARVVVSAPDADVLAGQFEVLATPPVTGVTKTVIVFTVGSDQYTTDGITQYMDVAPVIENGRVYVPVRYAGYAIGMADSDIRWDPVTGTATFSQLGHTVVFTLGSKVYLVNGAAQTMDVEPLNIKGRIEVPIRYFMNAFGFNVTWDSGKQEIVITPGWGQ